MNIALFASGTGSNAFNIWMHKDNYPFLNIKCVIIDQENAPFIQTCKKHKIPFYLIPKKNSSKRNHEEEILEVLEKESINWILLAGFMRILSPDFINKFYDKNLKQARIINIHPSLLPKHKGLHAFEKTFESEDKVGGITIHFIDSGIDTGKIIMQESFEKKHEDTLDDFKARGQRLEHKLYPEFLTSLNQYIGTKNIKEFLYEN